MQHARTLAWLVLLSACAPAETLVRIEVLYDDAWALDELTVASDDMDARVRAVHEIVIRLGDDAADVPLDVVVTGLRQSMPFAEGRVTVVARLGEEVTASVTLARLACDVCTEDERQCTDDAVVVCERNADACLVWSEPEPCGDAAPFCSSGVCGSECADECSADERTCAGPSSARGCGQADSDSCLDWLPAEPCADGTTCTGGECTETCTDECTVSDRMCGSPTSTRACGQADADSCLDWLAAQSCEDGETCTDGECSPGCVSECTLGAGSCSASGEMRCEEALPGCFRWGPADPCDSPPTPTACYVATGTCSGTACAYAFDDGASCDDGSSTTVDDVCSRGVCAGTPSGRWVGIVAGYHHSCAIRTPGEVYCWGYNVHGQIGNGSTTTPQTTPARVTGLTDAVELASGYGHTCARRRTGSIACWGNNLDGQLGNASSAMQSATRVDVMTITNAIEITAGQHHTCARTTTGAVYCWGDNTEGQLGDGTTTERRAPVLAMVSGALEIAAGGYHTCARRSGGTVVCWGRNDRGQLGDGSMATSWTPVSVLGLSGAVEIGAGLRHSCARLSDGTVECWGDNGDAQLGVTGAMSLVPVPVRNLSGALEIAPGADHTCARLASSVRCWGDNEDGELGNATNTDSSTPTTVSGLSDATALATTNHHVCALRAAGTIVCWGDNRNGQIGDGTTTNRNVPTLVMLPPPP
ncbi:RCC1 domain-containing protein [Sandaracinus amylolyticus]|uniref:RCC1 domain-containing protein n=1 Tax=Sandaracinus amylolyticus TaxID=927083 RepID=UPI001F415557|nr:RCC1 domain-containing protein [Sandaracinus amylolyticus]UJR79720.1 Hypothetical protein I5071_17580 [Sandaracinus amylolyticus]